jgi:hypothetical protein
MTINDHKSAPMTKQKAKGTRKPSIPEETGSTVVNTSMTAETYGRLVKFRNKYGLLTDPEVIRLALATLLEKHGI